MSPAERLAKTAPPPSVFGQIETALHVVNLIPMRLKCRVIAERYRPDIGIVRMDYVPTDAGFAHTALQVLNIGRLLEIL